jgi:hypothetical protein
MRSNSSTLPWRIVLWHTLAIAVAGIIGAATWGWELIFADDIYFPYFLISGPGVAFFSYAIARHFDTLLFDLLPVRAANMTAILLLPGVFNAILGGIQWYWLAWAWTKWKGRRGAGGVGFPVIPLATKPIDRDDRPGEQDKEIPPPD